MLTSLLALLVSPAARAQEQDDTDTSSPEPESTVSTPAPTDPDAAPPWKTRFGVRLVAGAPEGVGAAALLQPRRWLRVHVGATRNTLGYGVRGGLSLIPLQLSVSPSLNLEYGYSFHADYDTLLTRLHGQPTTAATSIHDVGYHQLSGDLGLEVSPTSYLTVFGGVGISYWFIGVGDGAKTFIRESVDDPAITSQPLAMGLSSPVVKLGLILYFN
ncbi:MAG: hypothetical protein ACXU86_11560 [Archangium sp.]